MNKWFENAVFYHIYPLGLCGAPEWNDMGRPPENRIEALHGWIPHLKKLGANAVYFGPVFESCRHGYDTIDYCSVDRRLGTNADFKELVKAFHDNGIKVVLDGVFNHVGREFLAFKDMQARREHSSGQHWFRHVDFGGNNRYNDGFSYSAWNNCQDLIELNLRNPEVMTYLIGSVKFWIDEFDIDGLRLDAADCLDLWFIEQLKEHTSKVKKDFWIMGEVLHSREYPIRTGERRLDSVTNYEVYKGLYSSHNDNNYFEIAYSLERMFGSNGLLKNKLLYNFVDNHDVNRIASVLKDRDKLGLVYVLLFTIPGIPSIYYGSEWGMQGRKSDGDNALRPAVDIQKMNETWITGLISKLSEIRKHSAALRTGDYSQLFVSLDAFAFMRRYKDETAVVALNQSGGYKQIDIKIEGTDNAMFHDSAEPGRTYRADKGKLRIGLNARSAAILFRGHNTH